MTALAHIATVNAYENKFGTFTGAFLDKETDEVVRERFPTLAQAKHWAQMQAWDKFGPVSYAPYKRKNEYLANVWKKS